MRLLLTSKHILSATVFVLGIFTVLAGLILDGVVTSEAISGLSITHVEANLSELRSKIPKVYSVDSGSMEPGIKTSSIVFTIPKSSYKTGDIITFRPTENSNYLVTHRILYKEYKDNAYSYTTSGDANEVIDPWKISPGMIQGEVLFSIPLAGYLSDFVNTSLGFSLLVIVPLTIFAYELLKSTKVKLAKTFQNYQKKARTQKLDRRLSNALIT